MLGIRQYTLPSKGIIRQSLRYDSSTTTRRPELLSLFPKKSIVNRILFDTNSRWPYRKVIPVLTSVYKNLDHPEHIRFPAFISGSDLMAFRSMLASVQKVTNTIDKNLTKLERELLEQAAELGDNDAIALLAFSVIKDPNSSKDDFSSANSLIKQLSDMRHPFTFKAAGDLAFEKNFHEQAASYWLEFLELENDTITASHVYSNLGIYYFSYLKPKPNLSKAKLYFEKSIKFGDLDNNTVRSHFYLGQLYFATDPHLSRYHLEIAASRSLKESFQTLGFLELNLFSNPKKALEWFKLGVEAGKDITCIIGQFDCLLKLNDFKQANVILTQLTSIYKQTIKVSENGNISARIKGHVEMTYALLKIFFSTRKNEITLLNSYTSK